MTRWGFLGCGKVAADFALGLKHLPDAVLSKVASNNRAHAEGFTASFGGQPCTVEELLQSDVDVVYVCTPNHLHREHAIAALEAGKPVLVEKPFALTLVDAQAIVSAAERAGKFCMEAMWSRLLPAAISARDTARSGQLGDVRLVDASMGFPIAVDEKHRVYNPKYGGGALLDLGVYAIHAVHAVLGAPQKVTANWVIGQTGVDETTLATLHYPHGVMARIACSIRHGCKDELSVHGTNGTLVLEAPLYRPETIVITPLTAQGGEAGIPVQPSKLKALAQRGEVRAAMGLLRNLRRTQRHSAIGNGYAHEAVEVQQSLQRHALQSDLLPLSESLAVMETVEKIRAAAKASHSTGSGQAL